MTSKKETILRVVRKTNFNTQKQETNLTIGNITSAELISTVISMLSQFSAISGIPYNEVLDDLKINE